MLTVAVEVESPESPESPSPPMSQRDPRAPNPNPTKRDRRQILGSLGIEERDKGEILGQGEERGRFALGGRWLLMCWNWSDLVLVLVLVRKVGLF